MKAKWALKDIDMAAFFFILTLAGTKQAVLRGLDGLLEYASFAILFIGIAVSYVKGHGRDNKARTLGMFLVVSALFSVGLCMQAQTIARKAILIMTMLAISASAILAENYMNTFARFKLASTAVLAGVLTSGAQAALNGEPLVTSSVEGFLGFYGSLSMGIQYKNYFAADMLIVLVGFYLYHRFVKRRLRYAVVVWLSGVAIILSNSRGAYIMLLMFIVMMNLDKIRLIMKRQRALFFFSVALIAVLGFIYLYRRLALNSGTYMYRMRGWLNYIGSDLVGVREIVLGNAELVYDQELDYVSQFRELFGRDGSMEFALLDIMIKNGILGVIGFVAIFVRNIAVALKAKQWAYKTACLAIAVTLLISALVETYIQSVHTPVGIYFYLAMAGLVGMCKRERQGEVRREHHGV